MIFLIATLLATVAASSSTSTSSTSSSTSSSSSSSSSSEIVLEKAWAPPGANAALPFPQRAPDVGVRLYARGGTLTFTCGNFDDADETNDFVPGRLTSKLFDEAGNEIAETTATGKLIVLGKSEYTGTGIASARFGGSAAPWASFSLARTSGPSNKLFDQFKFAHRVGTVLATEPSVTACENDNTVVQSIRADADFFFYP